MSAASVIGIGPITARRAPPLGMRVRREDFAPALCFDSIRFDSIHTHFGGIKIPLSEFKIS
ncbi:hypothetical protein [Burkholderia oklahomensis]|uniref:hypothetical protein n=1 Tax=Burkholderia oklahomensis TaxID=342113 RepID=UPI0002D6F1E8|nr:hypothetical protein [Burkholderia oklahomensis]QPS38825.1 hypothetical protein I6G57_08460 [Burkholderia oklahomensis]